MNRLLIISSQTDALSRELPGFAVERAHPNEALARIESGQPHCVVLLSAQAPDETQRAIHQHCDNHTIPILLGGDPAQAATSKLLDELVFDGFFDTAWEPRLIARCLAMAIDRNQVGRNLVGIQLEVLDAVIGEAESLKNLTTTDDLTRLRNLRSFRQVLEKEHQRCKRHGHPYSLVFLDLDNLKSVNLRLGHSAGSTVLTEIGDAIACAIRKSDFAFRIGGDEFVVLLVETTSPGARVCAENLRLRVAERIAQLDLGDLRVSISAGIASHPEHGESSTEVLGRADQALYRAKEQGKDRVVCFGDP